MSWPFLEGPTWSTYYTLLFKILECLSHLIASEEIVGDNRSQQEGNGEHGMAGAEARVVNCCQQRHGDDDEGRKEKTSNGSERKWSFL